LPKPEEALLPREAAPGAPVFAEPWQAELLAIVHALTKQGLFSAAEWADALGHALRHAVAHGEPDTDDTYYRAVLAALEELTAARSPETGAALPGRAEEWRRAYENTPHGKPVELAAAKGYAQAR
jgi:nitrile hydratase accessory protein